MTKSLLDILSGNQQSQIGSIQGHLSYLLNARQSSLAHMPDYGLPDILSIYQSIPYSIVSFTHAIKKCIEKYEPRLKKVFVLHRDCEAATATLHIEINAQLKDGERVQFVSYFQPSGKAIINS